MRHTIEWMLEAAPIDEKAKDNSAVSSGLSSAQPGAPGGAESRGPRAVTADTRLQAWRYLPSTWRHFLHLFSKVEYSLKVEHWYLTSMGKVSGPTRHLFG